MINKLILVGNVGNEIEFSSFTGTDIVNFSLATSRGWIKDGERSTETEWHSCKAFGGLAGVIHKYVKTGHLLYIEGRVKTRSYEKDGVKKYRTEVIVDVMQMLSKKE